MAHYLTAYGLIPKLATIVATQTAWSKLDAENQAATRMAAADTQRNEVRDLPERLGTELTTLCRSGVVIDELAAADLLSMASSARSAAPTSRRAQELLRRLDDSVTGLGPTPEVAVPPTGCRVAHTAAEAAAVARPGEGSVVHRGGVVIPPGTYVTKDTVADFRAGGVKGADWNKDITWTWVLRADGSVLETQVSDYPDQGPIRGRYEVDGDTVTFTWDAGTGTTPEVLRWSYFNGQLTFSIVRVTDRAGRVTYTAHPWRRAR